MYKMGLTGRRKNMFVTYSYKEKVNVRQKIMEPLVAILGLPKKGKK